MATPLHLLILEDNPSDAEVMLHTLRQAGYDPIFKRVETEEDFRDHLHPACEIVLADFSLPEFDALRALEIMQERQLDIPVIIVSGNIGEEHAVRVMQRGATDYVIKDRMERLGHAVTQALEQKRLRVANRRAEQALRESEELTRTIQQAKQQETEAHEKAVAVNEALMLGSLRQHELTEAAATANAQLQMEIGERMKAEASLREAAVRKNEFLAMLSHELRNPLAPISNMLEVMKRAGGNSDLIPAALDTIERQVRQMTRLIDDLLDVSRISQDKLELRREDVEFAPVITHVIEDTRSACDAAGHELTVTLPPRPVYLHADPARLVQVFANLLHNACKFTRPGGRVSLTAEQQGGEVVVTVEDSGPGIGADMLSKIFEMFTQADQTLERSHGGLGIGLALVQRLVTMHGGSVQAFSDGVGKGSRFVVRLPALIEKPESPEPAAGEPIPVTARRILVVDDNQDSANSLAMLLKVAGNETQIAFDGVEAVKAATGFRPDVILMDLSMPKLNGYDAARQIREQPWGKDLMLVALTGLGQEEDRNKTAEAGFDDHLVKPVNFDALSKLLASFPVVASPH